MASTRLLLKRGGGGRRQDGIDSNGLLVVNLPDQETSLPNLPAGGDKISYCPMAQVQAHLGEGFSGMLVLPADSLKDLNLQRIFESSKVSGVIIGGSRPVAECSGGEEFSDGS